MVYKTALFPLIIKFENYCTFYGAFYDAPERSVNINMSQEYKIQLGINFNDSELKNVKKQLTNLTNDTHRIRIDIDNSRLLKQVAHAKKELRSLNDLGSSKGNAPVLNINTKSVEGALNRVADSIDEIRISLNTLDGKSGMQSLVASVNQIASALGKATDESETLVKTLSALGKKDFSVNLGLNVGGSNNPIDVPPEPVQEKMQSFVLL